MNLSLWQKCWFWKIDDNTNMYLCSCINCISKSVFYWSGAWFRDGRAALAATVFTGKSKGPNNVGEPMGWWMVLALQGLCFQGLSFKQIWEISYDMFGPPPRECEPTNAIQYSKRPNLGGFFNSPNFEPWRYLISNSWHQIIATPGF